MARKISAYKPEIILEKRSESVVFALLHCALDRGLTLLEIAEMAGVSRVAIENWMSGGEAEPLNLAILAASLEVDDQLEMLLELRPPGDSKFLSAEAARNISRVRLQLKKVSSCKEGARAVILARRGQDHQRTFLNYAAKKILLNILNKYEPRASFCLIPDRRRFDPTLINVGELEGFYEGIDDFIESQSIGISEKRYLSAEEILGDWDAQAEWELFPEEKYFVQECYDNNPDLEFCKYYIYWGFGIKDLDSFQGVFEWLSDRDGEEVSRFIFSEISKKAAEGATFTTFIAHTARYSDIYDGDSKGGLRIFLFEGIDVPLKIWAIKWFFETLGFKIIITCDKPEMGSHRIDVAWG